MCVCLRPAASRFTSASFFYDEWNKRRWGMHENLRLKIVIWVLAGIVLVFGVAVGILFATGVFTTRSSCSASAMWPSARRRRKQELAQVDTSKHGMPLYWNPGLGVYMARLTIGAENGSKIWTAVDTGSSRFVVNVFDYDGKGTGVALTDPREGGATHCTAVVTYVSQTSNLQMFADTLLFPQIEIDWSTMCGASPVTLSQTVLALDDCAIGVSKSGAHGHVNVFGLSAVKTHEKSVVAGKHTYFLPSSCQTSDEPAYESPVMRAAHALLQKRGLPFIWAICFLGNEQQDDIGPHAFISFGPVRLPCLEIRYTPMILALPRAPSSLGRAPGRYYVVEVDRCVYGDASFPVEALKTLPGFPKFLLIDTGSTQFLLPGQHASKNAAILNGLDKNQVAHVVLASGVAIPFKQDVVSYNDDKAPVFGVMDDAVARNFSLDLDTGIFGCTAMRGLYVEFDCDGNRVGFAPLSGRCVSV